jgi:hypothetical protein
MTRGSSRLPPGAPVAAPVSPAALSLVTPGFHPGHHGLRRTPRTTCSPQPVKATSSSPSSSVEPTAEPVTFFCIR